MLAYAVTTARQQLVARDGYVQHVPAEAPQHPGKVTFFLSTCKREDVEALPDGVQCDITNLHRLNDVRYLNKFLKAVNQKLPEGGHYTGCVITTSHTKRRIFERYHPIVAWIVYVLLFIWRRVLPKLRLTRKLYFAATQGRNRAISTAELFGRCWSCGFRVISHTDIGDQLYFTALKERAPDEVTSPSYGPIFKMRRKGRDGKDIYIYKFRTMYPFSEFLQPYVYEQNKLAQNGKFKDDFRVTTWGKWLRRIWVDELPMVVNWFKGDVKLVGVRPLSDQFLSLYPEPVASCRLRHRPGLVPPYYADMPKSFDEIVESERKYLEEYEKNPLLTDARYFSKALYNILCKGARSA